MEGRAPADLRGEIGRPSFDRLEAIPPYLLSPEGMEAPLPEITELPPEIPPARKPQGGRLLKAVRSGVFGHRPPAHDEVDPHGWKQRLAPNVTLREHRVHGRGQ